MNEDNENPSPDVDVSSSAEDDTELHAEWGYASERESRWPATLAVSAAIVLYTILPDRIVSGLGPRWLIPSLEGLIGLALWVANPHLTKESARLRVLAITLIAIVNIANVVSLAELLHGLLANSHGNSALINSGRQLVIASVPVWLTNVLVFALWYWELDRGGPPARLNEMHRQPDFLFPQMTAPHCTTPRWTPSFFDYLYTSFTNATAFSPTDTMPLTSWAKLLMMAQSLASLLTVAIVVSRAVNILS